MHRLDMYNVTVNCITF